MGVGPGIIVNDTEFEPSSSFYGNQLITLSDGKMLAIWVRGQRYDETDYPNGHDIIGRLLQADGTPIGEDFMVNQETANDQYFARAHALKDGGFVISWSSTEQFVQTNFTTATMARIYDNAARPLGDEFAVQPDTNRSSSLPDVAQMSDGTIVFNYSQNGLAGGANGDVTTSRFSVDGTRLGDDGIINTTTTATQTYSKIAALSDARAVVTWLSYDPNDFPSSQDGDEMGVYAQIIDSAGNKIGPEIAVNTTTAERQAQQEVVGLSDGGFVVAWISGHYENGTAKYPTFQIFNSNGTKRGSEMQLDDEGFYSGNIFDSPINLVATPDGGFWAIWDPRDITAQKFDANGQSISEKVLFNVPEIGFGGRPELTLHDDGTLSVLQHVNSASDGAGAALVVQNYVENISPTGLITLTGVPTQDRLLRVDLSDFNDPDGLGDLSYEWLRNGQTIPDAAGDTYRTTAEDAGTTLSVAVSYTDGTGDAERVQSELLPIFAPVFGTDVADNMQGEPGRAVLSGLGGDDFLFGDGIQIDKTPQEASQVFRLYKATLDRAPDLQGINDWTHQLFTGEQTINEVAAGFVGSREFQNVYGSLNDEGFVNLLYNNVLDRDADDVGLATWLEALGNGTSRAEVVVGFSDSRELINQTRLEAAQFGITSTPSNWSDEVYRIYQATLDRAPDLGGFNTWSERLASGTTLEDVIAGFVGSTEFQNVYGTLDNTAFVNLLYNNVLDRPADSGGLADWLGQLEDGASRAAVVTGFSESSEFIASTTPDLEAWMRTMGADDILNGGSGTNTLMGGALSDTFVFDAGDDGHHIIHDLERWDTLAFVEFGYTSTDQIRADMTDVGYHITFSASDVMVTLLFTQASDITDDMLAF